MNHSLGVFRAALLAGWVALSAAGTIYARSKGVPAWVAAPVVAAFLFEYTFYLIPGFTGLREWFAPRLSAFLVASFVAPYAVYALGTGQFRWLAMAQLLAVAAALGLWYRVLPRSAPADIGFLALAAAIVLRGYFERIYTSPMNGLHLEILGHLALVRLCAMVMLVERGVAEMGFGFIPNRREWKLGLLYFAGFLLVGGPIAWALHLVQLAPPAPLWKIAATFLGFLWVVALSEEFFFRGLLQEWLTEWTGSAGVALVFASAVFGLCHLGFRGFPNWKFAFLAAIAGLFYGSAFRRAGSIRAGMVTHALVVTLWRALFV